MRTPLIVLITAYSIATVGFTLLPGIDDEGNPWRMSLFEAFYVVSYTGSTIGFGEIPYEFTPAQRLWTIVSIYLTVIAWLFSIGSVISLLQDASFAGALRHARFRRSVRDIGEPFYLLCGYGDTGRMLTRALTDQRYSVVVVDNNVTKINALSVEDLRAQVPASCADARQPDTLVAAGLRNRWCVGVIAVTGSERANLKIAITAKLLNHRAIVYARADTQGVAGNMRSFATDHVINPVEEYVRRMRLAIEKPNAFRFYHWLASGPDVRVPETRQPPRGRWILCGFGRLGRAVHAMLTEAGMTVTVIEEDPGIEGLPDDAIEGRGTQAETLTEAGIASAAGILATTRSDVDNLSILMTARELNEDLFFGALENGLSSHDLFHAAKPDFIAQPSRVVAGTILSRIRSSLVEPFLEHLLEQEDSVSRRLLEKLSAFQSPEPPEISSARISARRSPAVARALEDGTELPLSTLLHDPARRTRPLPIAVLMLRRDERDYLLPESDMPLELGDRLLLAGRTGSVRRLRAILESDQTLTYVLTGKELQQGWVWNWLSRQNQ